MSNISVIGNIGCGKSTLLDSLVINGYDVAFEPVNEWKFLNKFYEDMKRWCFTLQVEILNSFKVMDIKGKIVERSPWEACNIFAKNSYLNNLMTDEEYAVICEITKNVGYKPDVFIYLRSTPELCIERIKIRNRHCENTITQEYIEQLHELYDQCIEDLVKEGKTVFVVDAYKNKDIICDEVVQFLEM